MAVCSSNQTRTALSEPRTVSEGVATGHIRICLSEQGHGDTPREQVLG